VLTAFSPSRFPFPYPTYSQVLCGLTNEWKNVVMMPDGVALRDIEDDCTALYHALVDLSLIIVLTWPPIQQPSLGTEGGQPPAQEQQLYLRGKAQLNLNNDNEGVRA